MSRRALRRVHSTVRCTSNETCARHVRRAISPASLDLESYKLVWANPCPNPDHTPICRQIGEEMPEKSVILWAYLTNLKIFSKSAISLAFFHRFGWKLVSDHVLARRWHMPNCSPLGLRMPEILPVSRDVHMSHLTYIFLYISRTMDISIQSVRSFYF